MKVTATEARTTTFGFDGLRLQGQRFGIGRYIEYLLKHMDQLLEPSERMIVYVREPWSTTELGLSDAFEARVLPSRLDGVWWEHFVLARRWRETDVMFCPSYTVPLNYRGKLVVATHSVNEKVPGSHPWWYHLTYRPRNTLSARKADAVIVPSETAKKDVQELYGVRPEKMDIVPEGVDDAFVPVEDEAVLREVRRRYLGGDYPYVLFVGKFSQRRNIPALVEAFANVKRSDGIPHKLLLYGENVLNLPIDELAERLGVRDSVVQLNEALPDHSAIMPVYSAADLFVHPTAYEGFSLTICEAMACGTPVITVGRGAVAEIVEGAAYTVDEPTPDQLASAIRAVLGNRELQVALRAKALEQIAKFRFSATARGTLDVMRRVAAQ